MNQDNDRLDALLKRSLPPVGDVELQRDLWPDMLARMARREVRSVRFGLFDWILTGLVAASVLAFPGVIPGLLYHR